MPVGTIINCADARLEPEFESYELADAVAVEPVSSPKFPANREFYREFCKIVASGAPETANNGFVIGHSMRIPYSTEQGIIFVKQGILAREQGISRAKKRNHCRIRFPVHTATPVAIV